MGVTQKELAEVISSAVERTVAQPTYANWERGRGKIPADVESFLEALADGGVILDDVQPAGGRLSDTEPRDHDAQPAPVLAIGSSYSALCEQFFELIATAVGMLGAALGSPELMADGQVIDADKKALGAAYGKLAETNETFRNLLIATDKQGAYLAVALTTGATIGKIWRNHQVLPAPGLHAVVVDEPPPADDAGTAEQ
jgi:transcriptional regulator with XRE-family HTH domain